jgi:hypothetical protein
MNPRTAQLKQPANTRSQRDAPEVERTSAFCFRKQTRRRFLRRVSGVTAAAMGAGTGGLPALLDTRADEAAEIGPETPQQRRRERLGLDQAEWVCSGGAPIPVEVLEFFSIRDLLLPASIPPALPRVKPQPGPTRSRPPGPLCNGLSNPNPTGEYGGNQFRLLAARRRNPFSRR